MLLFLGLYPKLLDLSLGFGEDKPKILGTFLGSWIQTQNFGIKQKIIPHSRLKNVKKIPNCTPKGLPKFKKSPAGDKVIKS